MRNIIISAELYIEPPLIVSKISNRKYCLKGIESAITRFNAGCPCVGGYLDRNHIQRYDCATHLTHELFISGSNFCAEIELIDDVYDAGKLTIKPIIISPFDDEDGITRVLDIKDVRIYEKPQP